MDISCQVDIDLRQPFPDQCAFYFTYSCFCLADFNSDILIEYAAKTSIPFVVHGRDKDSFF